MTNTEMTEEEWLAQYTIWPNHLNPDAPWELTEDGEQGCLFETYGEELAFVESQEPARIWTLLDAGDDGELIQSGRHFVNRLGYFISEQPVPDGAVINVLLPRSEYDQ